MAIHLWFRVQWSELMFNGPIRSRKSILHSTLLQSTQIYKTPTRYNRNMLSNVYFETTIRCKYVLIIYTNVAIILTENGKFNNKYECWHFVSDMNIINLLSGYSKHQVSRWNICVAHQDFIKSIVLFSSRKSSVTDNIALFIIETVLKPAEHLKRLRKIYKVDCLHCIHTHHCLGLSK